MLLLEDNLELLCSAEPAQEALIVTADGSRYEVSHDLVITPTLDAGRRLAATLFAFAFAGVPFFDFLALDFLFAPKSLSLLSSGSSSSSSPSPPDSYKRSKQTVDRSTDFNLGCVTALGATSLDDIWTLSKGSCPPAGHVFLLLFPRQEPDRQQQLD